MKGDRLYVSLVTTIIPITDDSPSMHVQVNVSHCNPLLTWKLSDVLNTSPLEAVVSVPENVGSQTQLPFVYLAYTIN
jgi:hypothetical protein